MKNVIAFAIILLFTAVSIGPAMAGTAEDFLALGRQYELDALSPVNQSSDRELSLNSREQELTNRLLASEEELAKVAARAGELELGLLARLIARVQFEITQEGRTSLQPSLKALMASFQSLGGDLRGKKKIANIYGNEVNLLDGEWNTTPDGRRYWTSNEYPDIILTPADYRRYMATAVTVED